MSDEKTTPTETTATETTTVETEATPSTETETANEAPIQPEVTEATPAETKDAEAPVVEPKATEAPVKLQPAFVNYFEQYVEFAKSNKFSDDVIAEKAIKALNNSVKEMLKAGTASAFNTILSSSKKYKDTLTIEKALQGIATLGRADRAVVEIVTTVLYMINNPSHKTAKSINLETVRSVVKNEAFVNWCAKKIG